MKTKIVPVLFCIIFFFLSAVDLAATGIDLVAKSLPGLGLVDEFAMCGEYAVFVTNYKTLNTIKLDDDAPPRLAGTVEIPADDEELQSLRIYQDYAYLFYYHRYAVVSLYNPENPEFLRWVDFPEGWHAGEALQNGILYISSATDILAYIRSYSLDQPTQPVLLDSLAVGSLYPDEMVCGDGWLAFCKNMPWSVDISDPADMRDNGALPEQIFWMAPTMAAEGDLLVTASDYYLQVYDMSQEPVLLSSVQIMAQGVISPGYIAHGRFWCQVFISGSEIRFVAFDLSNPSQPTQCYTSEPLADGNGMKYSEDVMVARLDSEEYSFAKLQDNTDPYFSSSFPIFSIGYVSAQGSVLAGFTPYGTLCLLDPQADGSVQIDREQPDVDGNNLVIQGGYIYDTVRSETGWWLCLEVRQAHNGELLSSVELENAGFVYQILPAGNLVYVCCEDDGWYIIDVSNPLHPLTVYHHPQGGDFQCATVEGGRLWNCSNGMLYCYNVSSPSNPVLQYEAILFFGENSIFRPNELFKRGDYLYALTSSYIYCIKLDENGPTSVSRYDPRYTCASMLWFGDGLLVGSSRWISLLSLQDPQRPQEVAWYSLDPDAEYPAGGCFAAQDERVYVGTGMELLTLDGSRALELLQHPEQAPQISVYPNPATRNVQIGYDLPTASSVLLEIFNLRGQKVSSRIYNGSNSGYHLTEAELTDANGNELQAGIYLIRISADGYKKCGKVMILN
jgi:hypothetical protein